MSLFHDLGSGLRAAVKEYAEISNVISEIKDEVVTSVQEVKDEAAQLSAEARKSLQDGASAVHAVSKDVSRAASQSVMGYPAPKKPTVQPHNTVNKPASTPRKIQIQ